MDKPFLDIAIPFEKGEGKKYLIVALFYTILFLLEHKQWVQNFPQCSQLWHLLLNWLKCS